MQTLAIIELELAQIPLRISCMLMLPLERHQMELAHILDRGTLIILESP